MATSPPVVDQVQFSPFAYREGLARARDTWRTQFASALSDQVEASVLTGALQSITESAPCPVQQTVRRSALSGSPSSTGVRESREGLRDHRSGLVARARRSADECRVAHSFVGF